MKKSIWDKILKVVIAVASAILGALGANAMKREHLGCRKERMAGYARQLRTQ